MLVGRRSTWGLRLSTIPEPSKLPTQPHFGIKSHSAALLFFFFKFHGFCFSRAASLGRLSEIFRKFLAAMGRACSDFGTLQHKPTGIFEPKP